jgi:hypothetical protein
VMNCLDCNETRRWESNDAELSYQVLNFPCGVKVFFPGFGEEEKSREAISAVVKGQESS